MANKRITSKKLELDISRLNTIDAHNKLIALLRKNRLFNNGFLYRGSDDLELGWLIGKKRTSDLEILNDIIDLSDLLDEESDEESKKIVKNPNSICCYTVDEMKEIAGGKRDNKSPIYYALYYAEMNGSSPIILIYDAKKVMPMPAGNEFTHFQYAFRNFGKRHKALAAYVSLV